ncbi:hypothetical protein [Halobacillus naozhouensis]|uniref:YesK-like protein n=1 Tax=Halobacillus naozhouensis TaxID=554880 RepID=A0ABY8IU51_9BACI|nr:hypothetical protein [Halobacillus naozhouensis]WFT73619.1 hypothetical protein P9989_14730 [Halobacillus naozhouensis]
MIVLVIFYGFLINALVMIAGLGYYKLRREKSSYSSLLIVNLIVSGLGFLYGFTAGFFTYNDPYIVQTVGIMAFGMLIFCLVPLIFHMLWE